MSHSQASKPILLSDDRWCSLLHLIILCDTLHMNTWLHDRCIYHIVVSSTPIVKSWQQHVYEASNVAYLTFNVLYPRLT
jgi:hypothetical protein